MYRLIVILIFDREKKDYFFRILSNVFAAIQFTVEEEKDHQLPFLDVLMRRGDDDSLGTSVSETDAHRPRVAIQ